MSAPLLQVSALRKSFGGNVAVNDVSFTLQAGELLALIGPNGAGKSTTFNLVNGQLAPDSGRITLDGVSLVGRRPQDLWRLGVSRTFQVAQTFGSLTVVENVQMALYSHAGRLRSLLSRFGAAFAAEADALLDDNTRHLAVDVSPTIPVLIIDGDPAGEQANYLSDALAADPANDQRMVAIARTGIQEAFMWANRAVFQPSRVKLPEDTP